MEKGTPVDTARPRCARRVLNAMTVDVEDYFQVSAFEGVTSRADWDAFQCRVVPNTRLLLGLFARYGVRATFFVLGWVAERYPDLIREIHAGGHELASHGYEHRLVREMTPAKFREDLRRASLAIQSAVSCRIEGFRAPSFSIDRDTMWAYDTLRDEGYAFSSSVFPVRHDRYGIPDFPRRPTRLEGADGRSLWEFPMTTWRLLGRNFPAAGGGWMRLYPAAVTHRVIHGLNARGVPANVYIHPWEFDPEQPEVPGAPVRTRWRHRLNLGRMEERLTGLLRSFAFGPISQVLATAERSG